MNSYVVETYHCGLPNDGRARSIVDAESAIEAIVQHCALRGQIEWTSRAGAALRAGECSDNAHWQRNPSRGTVGAWAMRRGEWENRP